MTAAGGSNTIVERIESQILRYDDMGNTHILKFVPAGALVLDIGCSTGRRAAWLREHLGCMVAGIEVDEAMAELAGSRCDTLVIADLDNLPELPFAKRSFDLLIFGDVLEHLKDPEQVLRHLMEFLRPGGSVIISIPNFVFLDVRMKVLLGRFRYQESGILDRTHLHFYTRTTLVEMAERCGLVIRTWEFTPPRYGIIWRHIPATIRAAMTSAWPRLFATQFAIECVRSDQEC